MPLQKDRYGESLIIHTHIWIQLDTVYHANLRTIEIMFCRQCGLMVVCETIQKRYSYFDTYYLLERNSEGKLYVPDFPGSPTLYQLCLGNYTSHNKKQAARNIVRRINHRVIPYNGIEYNLEYLN